MSHFNLIAKANPEVIQEETHKQIASRTLELNNQMKKYTNDSADYFKEMDLAKKEKEAEMLNHCLLNPPKIQKKFPVIRTGPISGKKKDFDSADYFMELYKNGARSD